MARTQYAKNGEIHIAYQVHGDGPLDLVLCGGAATHLDVLWEEPAYRHFCEQLASFTRLIRFDKRGMGLSDRVRVGTLEERMEDVRAVMDAAGSKHAALMGTSEGGPMSMLFAASYPERTCALVLCGAEVRERKSEDWPWGESTPEEFEESMRDLPERWGAGRGIAWVAPSIANEATQAWWGKLQTHSMTPADAEAAMRMAFDIDVRHIATAIRVPTLIIHRDGDRVCHVENGRWLARNVPGARYVELHGVDHASFAGNNDIVPEIREFLTGSREATEPDRVLATVLFTDLVGSTELLLERGDLAWRDLLERHYATVRRELARFRGTEINTTGDGIFATFDGPARAIHCAIGIVDAVSALGLKLRAGLHTGECERAGGGLTGIAVHTGARIAATANAGEVIVSSTVRDLVAGSGLGFVDRGVHRLKGIDTPLRLFAVTR
ncbi:MAG TPA: adenylate/guanylate cyclase domain-containing protein [Casimicrobiaceae bacterium]|nr:adenylate/guanylate cyclase domain-containing protein [Casimicrobiaceae bacterium]